MNKKSKTIDEKTFKVWATGCAHVNADKKMGRDSLGEAITDSEKFFNNFGSSSSTSSDCQNFIFDIEEHEVNIITNDNTAKMFFIFISLCLRCIVIY